MEDNEQADELMRKGVSMPLVKSKGKIKEDGKGKWKAILLRGKEHGKQSCYKRWRRHIHNWSLQPFSHDYWPSFSHHLCCVS